MKIEQEPAEFKPITITLETREEVNFFWDLIRASNFPIGPIENEHTIKIRNMYIEISNWLSNAAKL